MLNTELFDFKFVDRENEQKILNNFFMNKMEKTLWIKGLSGMGKTTFFNYVYENWNEYVLCYLNIKSTDNSVEIVTNFIIELEKNCKKDFIKNMRENYKSFYNTTYKISKDITSDLFPTMSKIVSTILDLGYIAINKNEEKTNCINIVIEYIHSILQDKKLCICIDNFSRCDLDTARFFLEIFKTFTSYDYFKSCIMTTNEELDIELKEEIYRSLPCIEIKISQINNYIYFYYILDPIFNLQELDNEDIKYIYEKCDGSPKRLSTLISKLLEQDAIRLTKASKAQFDMPKLFSILQNERIRFGEIDFDIAQKWIIFSYLCLPEVVELEQLKNFAFFTSKKCYLFQAFSEEIFQQSLLNLIERKILKLTFDNKITNCHDIDYRELQEIFRKSSLKQIFSHFAYEFINMQTEFPERQALLCLHAREADIFKWEDITFRYGKKLAKSNQIYDAQKVFSSLKAVYSKLPTMRMLYIAIISYETGNYHLAIRQLEVIDLQTLFYDKAMYYYFFVLGKSLYNIGKVQAGIDAIQNALKYVDINSKEYVQALNILHMYYFEIPGKEEAAYNIFEMIRTNYKELHPVIWANTMRGCHNFVNNEEALSLLKSSEEILDNELERAYVVTTRGFVYVKNNDMNSAKKQFEEACITIKKIKKHEFTYAANNLALCYMLEKKYIEAKGILLEALMWNRTDYGKVVLQNHMMICAFYLGDTKECINYYNSLISYIDNRQPVDPIMKRKLYMNLAIISRNLNMPLAESEYFRRAEQYVINTSSEWRYYKWTKRLSVFKKEVPIAEYQLALDFDPWFLVYAHD